MMTMRVGMKPTLSQLILKKEKEKKNSRSKMIFNSKPIKFSFKPNTSKLGKELKAQKKALTIVPPYLEKKLKY